MDPLSIAMLLAGVFPRIAGWMDKSTPDRETIAGHVIDAACRITGLDDGEQAARAINESPEYQAVFIQQMTMLEAVREREGTKRLAIVNRQMRDEGRSNSWVQRVWRPLWGILSALAFMIQMIMFTVICYRAVTTNISHAAQTISALSGYAFALSPIWSVALIVLGVQVKERSKDKALDAGVMPNSAPGIIGAIASRIAGKPEPGRPAETGVDPDADAKTFGEGKPGK